MKFRLSQCSIQIKIVEHFICEAIFCKECKYYFCEGKYQCVTKSWYKGTVDDSFFCKFKSKCSLVTYVYLYLQPSKSQWSSIISNIRKNVVLAT